MEVIAQAQPQVAGQPPVETPATAQVTQETETLAERFAHLSRKEKEIRDREAAYKEREKKFKEESETFAQRQSRLTREALLKNPTAFFDETGIKVEEFLKAHLDFTDGKTPTADPLSEIEILKKQFADEKKAREEEKEAFRKAQEERAVTGFKSKIADVVKESPDDFELVNLYGATDDVYDVIYEYYQENGKHIAENMGETIKVAAKQVEDYLADYISKGRTAKRFVPAEPVIESKASLVVDPEVKEKLIPKPSAPTLTNRQPVGTQISEDAKTLLSREESLRKVAATLKWK